MADRPILFSGEMTRALLAGTKTQTRRDLTKTFEKYPHLVGYETDGTLKNLDGKNVPHVEFVHSLLGLWHPQNNPGGRSGWYVPLKAAVGDRLWVREGWWIATRYTYGTTPGGCEIPPPPLAHRKSDPVHYAADGDPKNHGNRHYGPDGLRQGSGAFAAPDPYAVWLKKPSIHMPRWASRTTLQVTDVRVERLQDISEADAVAEGCFKGKASGRVFASAGAMHIGGDEWANARDWYADLWNSINGEGSWDANPWVVAYTFTVQHGNIDQIARAA